MQQAITLAALLHDIGKVGQRAQFPSSQEMQATWGDLDIAPVNSYQQPYLTHVWWTADLISQYHTFLKERLCGIACDDIRLHALSAKHHRPFDELSVEEKIVALADTISSGIDRTEKLKDDTRGPQHRSTPLTTIWSIIKAPIPLCREDGSTLQGMRSPTDNDKKVFALRPLDISAHCLPQEASGDTLVDAYRVLWDAFREDFKDLISAYQKTGATLKFRGFVDTLLYILQRYLWAVPAYTIVGSPVSSLFDHSKTTAAFAHSLYAWICERESERVDIKELFEGNKLGVLKKIAAEHPFLLVGGDVSGIQSFLYDIYSNKAKKALKGRSFFLQMLTEIAIEKILRHKDIDAYRTNVLYSSGGKFFLILPNTPTVRNALDSLQKEIEEELWNKFQNTLSLNIAYQPFGFYSELTEGEYENHVTIPNSEQEAEGGSSPSYNVGDLWGQLSRLLQEKKATRWLNVVRNNDEIFIEAEEGGTVTHEGYQICRLTGRFLQQEEIETVGRVPYQKIVAQQIELGKYLARAQWIALHELRGETNTQDGVQILGWNIRVIKKDDPKTHATVLLKINDTDIAEVLKSNPEIAGCSLGYYFYGGNRRPMVKKINKNTNKKYEAPASFEDMAQKEELDLKAIERIFRADHQRTATIEEKVFEEVKYWLIPEDKLPARSEDDDDDDDSSDKNRSYLGILRCDVDNLGMLFIYGLDPQHKSFANISTLSSQLQWFFSGYINTLQAADVHFRHHMEIIYAGGDDVFIVGRWDVVWGFARILRQAFREFVNGRADISLSGGFALVRVKYPISMAAHLAGSYEDKAKDFCHLNPERHEDKIFKRKDAISFQDVALGWAQSESIDITSAHTTVYHLNEIDFVTQRALDILALLRNGTLSHSMLNKLLSLYRNAQLRGLIQNTPSDSDSSYAVHDPHYTEWYWHMLYLVSKLRNKDKHKSREIITTIKNNYLCGDNTLRINHLRAFVLMSVAVEMALLLDRHFPKPK